MEFKRYHSYFYRYEENIKHENCGFAKIEIKDHNLRIQMSVKKQGNPTQVCKIYALLEEGNSISVVYLKDASAEKGNYNIRIHTETDNIMGKGISFRKTVGILLKVHGEVNYVAMWDETPLDMKKVKWDAHVEIKTSRVGIDEKELEKEEKNDNAPQEEIIVDQVLPRENKKDLDFILEESKEKQLEKKEKEQKEREFIYAEVERKKRESIKTDIEQKELNSQEIKLKTKENKVREKELEQADSQQNFYTPHGQTNQVVKWERIQLRCPMIKAFHYQDKGVYLKITPKEIWFLPKEEWVFGSNSFLLHGYYSYRYLIFGKTDHCYLLGVPGRYFEKEKETAEMFGFHIFRPSERQRVHEGQFGYWCRVVKENQF